MINPPSESLNMGIGGISTARKVKGQEAMVSTHVKSLPTPVVDDDERQVKCIRDQYESQSEGLYDMM